MKRRALIGVTVGIAAVAVLLTACDPGEIGGTVAAGDTPSSQTVILDRRRSIAELTARLGTSIKIESLEVVFDDHGRESFILVPPVRDADSVVAQYHDAYSRHVPLIRGLLLGGMSPSDDDAAYNAARLREVERLEARMAVDAEDLYVSHLRLHGPPSEVADFRAWLAGDE